MIIKWWKWTLMIFAVGRKPKIVKISFPSRIFVSFPFILPSTITTPQQVHCLLLLAVVLLLNSNRRGGVLFKGTPVIPLFDMHSPLIPPRVIRESNTKTARGWFLLHHHSSFNKRRRTSVCPLHIPCSHIINGFRDERLSTDLPNPYSLEVPTSLIRQWWWWFLNTLVAGSQFKFPLIH